LLEASATPVTRGRERDQRPRADLSRRMPVPARVPPDYPLEALPRTRLTRRRPRPRARRARKLTPPVQVRRSCSAAKPTFPGARHCRLGGSSRRRLAAAARGRRARRDGLGRAVGRQDRGRRRHDRGPRTSAFSRPDGRGGSSSARLEMTGLSVRGQPMGASATGSDGRTRRRCPRARAHQPARGGARRPARAGAVAQRRDRSERGRGAHGGGRRTARNGPPRRGRPPPPGTDRGYRRYIAQAKLVRRARAPRWPR
jgi:hypothetical protein